MIDKPHTRTVLVAILMLVIYRAYNTANQDVVSNTKQGILTASLVFLLMGTLMFRDGIFIRPHPVFWRVVLGCSVLYELALILLLFQVFDLSFRFLLKHSCMNRISKMLGDY